MDPILTPLLLQVALEALKLANNIVESQPPEVARAAWQRNERFVLWLEKQFGIVDAPANG